MKVRDYIGLLPSTAAVINGFIAVLVAQFFKDSPRAKIILVVAAGLLGAAAIGATFYSQHRIITERLADTQNRKEIRDQLGVFIAEGLNLMTTCANNSEQPRWKETTDWISRINKFLETRLAHSYVVRLVNPAGVPINVVCRDADAAHNDVYRILFAVNFHLEEFSKEAN